MDNKTLTEYRNKFNSFAIFNQAKILEISEGHAVSEVIISKDSLNPIGSVHGAAIFLAADNACGGAASSYGYAVTTLDTSISYLRPGINCTRIVCVADVIKHGKHISVLRFKVMDQDDVILAEGLSTFSTLDKTMEEVFNECVNCNGERPPENHNRYLRG